MEPSTGAWVMGVNDETKTADVILTFTDDPIKISTLHCPLSQEVYEQLVEAKKITKTIIPVFIEINKGISPGVSIISVDIERVKRTFVK